MKNVLCLSVVFSMLMLIAVGCGNKSNPISATNENQNIELDLVSDLYSCIDLEKTGPTTANPGEIITYHFWVKNCGETYLGSGAYVYDPLLSTSYIWYGHLNPGDIVEFDRTYTIPQDYCGDLINTATAKGYYTNSEFVTDPSSWTVAVICEPREQPGTGTPGYWKNHPDAWPINQITIGGVTYTKDEAIAIMNTPEKGDKTFTLFRALVSAELNVLIGNESSCIYNVIASADQWMMSNGPVGSGIRANSNAWKEGEPLYEELDNYNNGKLCAPHRD